MDHDQGIDEPVNDISNDSILDANVSNDDANNERKPLTPEQIAELGYRAIIPFVVGQIGLLRRNPLPEYLQNVNINYIKIVACVASIRETEGSALVIYSLFDGTGCIHALLASDANQFIAQCKEHITEGIYVVAVLSIKKTDDDLKLTIRDIRPISNSNQITYHYLDAIYTRLLLIKNPLRKRVYDTPQNDNLSNNMNSLGSGNTPINAGGDVAKDVVEVVYQYIKRKNDNGSDAYMEDVVVGVKQNHGNFLDNDIRLAILDLDQNRRIFHTSDYDHYRIIS